MNNNLTEKQEAFAFNIAINGMTQHDAYMGAYNTGRMLPATIDREAHVLASTRKITTRIEELREKHRSPDIADFEERQAILSEITRGKLSQFTDSQGIIDRSKLDSSAIQGVDEQTIMGKMASVIKLRLHNPINAIAELNKMDHVYEATPASVQDNRVINIYVMDQETKDLMLKAKERTGRLIEGGSNGKEGTD